jgi:hypothetical protein
MKKSSHFSSKVELQKAIERFLPGGFTTRDEANALVALALCQGPLETLFGGDYAELLEGKQATSAEDLEIKAIVEFACERVAWLLEVKKSDPELYDRFITSYAAAYCHNWTR